MANPVKVLTRLVSEEGIELSGSAIFSGSISVVGQHTASFYNLEAIYGNYSTSLTASNLYSPTANITNLSSSQITSSVVSGTYGYFENLQAVSGNIINLTSSDIEVKNLIATQTISAPNFFINSDAIIASEVIQVNELVANYVSASQVSASNLLISQDTVIIGDYVEAGTLYVGNDAEITGNVYVSGDVRGGATGSFNQIYITKPETYYVINPAYNQTRGLDLVAALKLLDSANSSVITSQQVEQTYRSLRYFNIGIFENGKKTINLSQLAPKFTADLVDYLSINVMVRNLAVDGPNWRNDLVPITLRVSNDKIFIDIEAVTDADQYKLVVINEKDSSFSINPW